jgi:hypothetical protein
VHGGDKLSRSTANGFLKSIDDAMREARGAGVRSGDGIASPTRAKSLERPSALVAACTGLLELELATAAGSGRDFKAGSFSGDAARGL